VPKYVSVTRRRRSSNERSGDVTRKEKAKAKARAAWRAWYRRNPAKAKAYYKKRYKERLKNETAEERDLRMARARKNQKKYAKRIKKLKG
jgi:hypothetical protein